MGTPQRSAGTRRAALAPIGPRLKAANAVAAGRQCSTLKFFFDDAGNNFYADVGTKQHGNVAIWN